MQCSRQPASPAVLGWTLPHDATKSMSSRRRAEAPSSRSPLMAMAERALDLGATQAVLVYVVATPDGPERRCVSLPDMSALETAGLLGFCIADLAAGEVIVENP